MIKKVAILFRVHTLLVNGEKIIETISEKELQKTNQTEFRVEKAMKKGNKLNVKQKGYDNSFNSWIDKKILLYEMSYFPELCIYNKNKIKFELNLCNYATKCDLKRATVVDTSNLAK